MAAPSGPNSRTLKSAGVWARVLAACKFASNSDPLRGIIASNSDPF
jgi:hypothetical protein